MWHVLLVVTPLSTVQRVAIVLHGRIGIWKTRSSHIDDPHVVWIANAPQAWKSAPKSMAGIDVNASAHTTLAGFAAFGRASLWQYVVTPNRAAGLTLDLFLHSWHTEIGSALDAMYSPVASQHDKVNRGLNSVRSQHLSMKTALGLMTQHEAASGRAYDLVMVTRYDILFFTPLMLQPLGDAPLWLPHWCNRYPLSPRAGMLVRAACGNWPGHGEGYLVHPATATGVHPGLRRSIKSRDADFDFAYLDWWFVATPAIARTWGQIYDDFQRYRSALARVADFPVWSHFYWAHHINRKLRMRRLVRHVLYEGVDFRLARHWHFGSHCISFLGGGGSRVGMGSGPAEAAAAAAAAAADAAAANAAALAAASYRESGASSAVSANAFALTAPAGAAAVAADQAAAAAATAASAVPGSTPAILADAGVSLDVYYRRRLKQDRAANETRQPAQLARQCPFDPRVRLYCPWQSSVCPPSLRTAVLDSEEAAHVALKATSKIPPWRLYNEEETQDARREQVERTRSASIV